MLLTTLWQEVGQPVKEEPSAQVASVLRMDSEALILETNAQSGIFLGLGIFVMFLVVTFFPIMMGEFLPRLFDVTEAKRISGRDWWIGMAMDWFIVMFGVVLMYLALWIVNLGLIQPAPSPIIFNRKTGKVYGSHRGRALELDWQRVRPVLTKGKLFINGAQTFYNLVLFQPESTEHWFKSRSKRGVGLIVTAGHAWGWGTCHQLWEFIRRYMDEDPKQAAKRLPLVEIAPPSTGWVGKVLDQGPYHDATEDGKRMQRLRDRNGKPELNAVNTSYVTFMGPGSLMSVFQAFARRAVKLPTEWWPTPASGPNPYQTTPPKAEDQALRLKAAKIVAPWLVATVGGGCALWFGLAWLITHSV